VRYVKIGTAALVGLLGLLGLALLLSAVLDRPARTIESEITVDASEETVWDVLTDFDSYSRWNPFITQASGEARVGSALALQLKPPGGELRSVEPEVSIVKEDRKIRWQYRTYLPGVADREYEAIIEPLDDGQVRVIQRTRFEGVLAPFVDVAREEIGLDLMAEALKKRAEEATPGTVIRVTEGWDCTRPLESYGNLPIIIESRIDNEAIQPEMVDAVALTGPNCTGDGNPNTIDLILRISGDGGGVGATADAVKLREGPHDINITGYANCGKPAPGAHQDGIQAMLGYRITFSDFRVGDPDQGRATCDGAAGGLFIEERSEDDPMPEDILCIRCEMITVIHGLLIGDSVRSGARESTFTAEHPISIQPTAVEPINERNEGISREPGQR
jgi:hypothetical protein